MLPVVIGIIELAGYAITAYELYRTAANAYDEVKTIKIILKGKRRNQENNEKS